MIENTIATCSDLFLDTLTGESRITTTAVLTTSTRTVVALTH